MSEERVFTEEQLASFAQKLLRAAKPFMGIDDKGKYTIVHWCQCIPYCDEREKE